MLDFPLRLLGSAPFCSVENSQQGAGAPELVNFLTLIAEQFHGTAAADFLHRWQNIFFSLLITAILGITAFLATRRAAMVPHPLQNFVEALVEALDNFIVGILGERGRRFVPFLGTLFIYILSMNLFGLLPFMKSPTSAFTTTLPLALCVFFYVQYTGLRALGPLGYLTHMAGSPKDAIGWALAPVMFVIHIFGEFIKPVSLSLRLFGNIWGEDILIAVFVLLGVSALKFLPVPAGIPFQTPFIFLAIITSVVQAMVFTLLSTIYIVLMLPHEEHL